MRDLPADVVIEPMPKGFTAHIVVSPDGQTLKWGAQLNTPAGPFRVEYGLRLRGNDAATMQRTVDAITATAWQCQELARIDRTDLLHYVRTDRHAKRPGRGRKLEPEALELLEKVKAAHQTRMAAET